MSCHGGGPRDRFGVSRASWTAWVPHRLGERLLEEPCEQRIPDASLTTLRYSIFTLGLWHEFWHDGARSPRSPSALRQKARVESVSHQQPEPVSETLHGGTWYDDTEGSAEHSLNVRGGIAGPWSERLPHFRLDAPPSVGGDELQTEYFVDGRYAVDAL